MKRTFEFVVNAATLATCLIVCVTLLRPIFERPSSGEAYRKGDRIEPVRALHLDQAERTLLMLLNNNCKYCAASMPFYRRLSDMVSNDSSLKGRAQLVIVTPDDPPTASEYLKSNGLTVEGIVSVPTTAGFTSKITGTPTLILTDRDGLVQDVWIGVLNDFQEAEVITKLLVRL